MPIENYEPRILVLDRTYAHELNSEACSLLKKAKTEKEKELWREVIQAYQICCTSEAIDKAEELNRS